MHPGCGMKFLVQPLSLYRFCTGLWWLSCPLQFLLGLLSCPGSCSGVTSLATFLSSLWSLLFPTSARVVLYFVTVFEFLDITSLSSSWHFETLWNTLIILYVHLLLCDHQQSLNWLLLFSAWCCLSCKENYYIWKCYAENPLLFYKSTWEIFDKFEFHWNF